MALTKPILNAVPSWDAQLGQLFTFNVVGGNQVVGATIYIVDNETEILAYSQTTTSFKYEILVPPNSVGLANGKYYNAYIVTRDIDGNTSVNSNKIQFYCLDSPTWQFTNVAQGGVVTNSTFVPIVSYAQNEEEPLSEYVITLYDAFQSEIASSGLKYTKTSDVPLEVSYTFSGLEDNTIYYIRATGKTLNGMIVDTSYIRFTVSYTKPSVYSQFFLSNNCNEGYITYTSNAALIEGKSNPSPPTYISNEAVDLTQNGSWVKWDEGFSVSGDFTLKAWVSNPTLGSSLITLENEDDENIIVSYQEDLDDSTKVYADLFANNYYVYSQSIQKPSINEWVCLQIRRINNIYEIKMEVV